MEKILIVEDEYEVRENLVEILKLNNYQVYEAQDGQAALELLKTTVPDLVISDIMMPKINGHELLRQMQSNERTATVPFIFLSAKINSSDIRHGMTLGADDYLTKPYDTKDLLNAVTTRLGKKKILNKRIKEISENISISVPHEMRTPLVSILGVSELITEHHDTMEKEELVDLVSQINSTGKRLHKTIEKFLIYYDINLLSEYKDQINESDTNEETEIEEAICTVKLKYMRNKCRGKDIKYDFENCNLKIARYHLEFVLEELLCNGCKFSQGDSKIQFSGYKKDDFTYSIEIKDSGIGMTENQINSIGAFNQFNKERLNQKGNGIGLAAVMKVLDHYSCSFEIDSVINEYTTIKIQIPIAKKKLELDDKIDTAVLIN